MADNVRKFGQREIEWLQKDYPQGEGLSIYIEDSETTFTNCEGEVVATGNGTYDLQALYGLLFPEATIDSFLGSDDGEEEMG